MQGKRWESSEGACARGQRGGLRVTQKTAEIQTARPLPFWHVACRGGAARLQSNQPVTAAGFGRGSSGGQQGRWGAGSGRQQQQPQRGAAGRGGGGAAGGGGGFGGTAGGGGAADEAAAEALRLVAEFPRPQRLYVLFLEAADSHRLNAHLARQAKPHENKHSRQPTLQPFLPAAAFC